MTFCSVPLAKRHPRPPQHTLYPLCQATAPWAFSSAAIPFTRLAAGENCPGSKDLRHPVRLVHQRSRLGFTLHTLLPVSPPFLLVALYKLHRQFAKKLGLLTLVIP